MKKTIYQIAILIIVDLMIVSCNKDTVPLTDEDITSANTEVYAGVYDTTFSYHEFTSPIEITVSWDSQNLYGVGRDSLDLDSNGTYDLLITLNLLNEDSLHLLNGIPNPFPSCVLNAQNATEIAYYTETYYIGLGQTATATFADRLDFNERIDLMSTWGESLKMWSENPGGAGTPPYGDWYSATAENYLAFKINDDNFGWIAIDSSSPKNPKILSYAVQD